MRQVFRQAYTLTYHEQKDPTQTSMPGVFAFDGITKNISSPKDLALAMASHPRFALAWTQKLCYWANSSPCSENDPEFQRIAAAFESSGHKWKTLVREQIPRQGWRAGNGRLSGWAEQYQRVRLYCQGIRKL